MKLPCPAHESLRHVRSQLPLLMLALTSLILPATIRAQVTFTGASRTVLSETSNPTAVAIDTAGNIYTINEQFNSFPTEFVEYSIEKFTLQSNGSYIGRKLITSSSTDVFTDLVVDADQNVYYTNTPRNEVAELINVNGTYANTKLPIAVTSPSAIAIDASGNLYLTDLSGDIFKETPFGHSYSASTVVGGLGSDVVFGVAVDPKGTVYIAEMNRQQFLVETPIEAGYSQASFSVSGIGVAANPVGIKVDSSGNVYVTDVGSNSVFEEVRSDGTYTQYTLLSGLATPTDLALDSNGNVFVTNTYGSTIEEVQLPNVAFTSQPVATNGTSSNTVALNFAIASGTAVGSVQILTTGASGKDFRDSGSSTCTAQTYATATTCSVNVNFAPLAPGARNGAVVIADNSGNSLATVPIYGTASGPQAVFGPTVASAIGTGLVQPQGVAVDGAGNVYSAVNADHIVKIAQDGTETNVGSGFTHPAAVAVDGTGNVYVVDVDTAEISRVTPAGVTTVVASGVENGSAVAVDGPGNIYFQKADNSSIIKVSTSGVSTQLAGGFESVSGLAVDAAGNLYAADSTLNSIFKITPSGVQTMLVSGLQSPTQIALDAAGNIYIAELGGNLLEFSNSGELLSTLATGEQISGVALDSAGNVYYTAQSSESGILSVIHRAIPPSFTFASTSQGQVSGTGTQTVTVENVGNANLQFSNLHTPSGFPAVDTENQCILNHLLRPGEGCNFAFEFYPFRQYTGSPSYDWSGEVVVTSNTLNTPGTTALIGASGTMTFPTVTTPVISPASGSVKAGQQVTITCATPGATIYYTTEPGQPHAGSPQYTGPITVSSSTVISALCDETGYVPSSIASEKFTITNP